MERIKKIGLLCVLLACVAPAMATDYVIENYAGNGADISAVTFESYVYDGGVDPSAWLASSGYGTTYASFEKSPFHTNLTTVTGLPAGLTTSDNVSFAHLTTNSIRFNTGSNMNVNRVNLADNYWRLSELSNGSLYSYNAIQQRGGIVTCNEFVIGSDIKPFTDNSLRGGKGLANYGFWDVRYGQLNIGTLRVANTCTDIIPVPQVLTYATPTHSEITTEIGDMSLGIEVNIGDISLNQSWLALSMTGGDWTISGDIIQQGNMVAMLFGTRNPGGDRIGDAELTIKFSTLLDMITNGQLFTRTGNVGTRYRPGYYDLRDPVAASTDTHKVTLANMYSELDIQDLGGGMVSVMLIPEPATLTLLALGAIAAFRRKR